jgi:antitoxin VapB
MAPAMPAIVGPAIARSAGGCSAVAAAAHTTRERQRTGPCARANVPVVALLAEPFDALLASVTITVERESDHRKSHTTTSARKKERTILPHMALNIKDDLADRLARELAAETGETITTAVAVALRERLERLRGAVPSERRREALTRLTDRSSARRVRDHRSADEIVGYGPDGLPS